MPDLDCGDIAMPQFSFVRSTFAIVLLGMAACSRGDQASDTAAPGGDSAAAMAAMPGHDMNRPPARDADQEFLRMMVDHHQGLVQMATAAMTKASQSATQGDAHNLHTKQADDQKKMIAQVQSQYGETLLPMVLPSNKAMIDSLAAKSGAEYDRTFYRNVIAHHREGIRMTDEFLPRLTKADVKQMAERMKAEQQKEIAEFERKAGA
jgi:uncharacterized protein (DUF305 family)